MCFGAKNNHFGKFTVTIGGRLASVKLVHFYGFVTCDTTIPYSYSYWGCSIYHSGLKDHVGVVITTSANRVLLPSSQFMKGGAGKYKWSKILGYNSFSPEIVLSVFSNPPSVSKGQELRLWYAEDWSNYTEYDNDWTSRCDVFARFIWISVFKGGQFCVLRLSVIFLECNVKIFGINLVCNSFLFLTSL